MRPRAAPPTRTRRARPVRRRSTASVPSAATITGRPRGGPRPSCRTRSALGDHLEGVSRMSEWPPQELHPDAYRHLVEGAPAIPLHRPSRRALDEPVHQPADRGPPRVQRPGMDGGLRALRGRSIPTTASALCRSTGTATPTQSGSWPSTGSSRRRGRSVDRDEAVPVSGGRHRRLAGRDGGHHAPEVAEGQLRSSLEEVDGWSPSRGS